MAASVLVQGYTIFRDHITHVTAVHSRLNPATNTTEWLFTVYFTSGETLPLVYPTQILASAARAIVV